MDFETFGAAKGSENRLVAERVFPALHHQGELVVYALRALLLQFDRSTRKSKMKTKQIAMKTRRKYEKGMDSRLHERSKKKKRKTKIWRGERRIPFSSRGPLEQLRNGAREVCGEEAETLGPSTVAANKTLVGLQSVYI